jgi:hypothetical protein
VETNKRSHVLGDVAIFEAEAYKRGVSDRVFSDQDVCLNLTIYAEDSSLVYGPESMNYDNLSQSFFSQANSIYWHVIENGIGDPQGIKNLDVSVNRPIHIKVEIAGDTYKAYVNGILKNTLIDNTYSSGKIAVCVNLNYPSPTTWDNILVRKYTSPKPTVTFGGIDPSPLIDNIDYLCASGVPGPLSALNSAPVPVVAGDNDTTPVPSIVVMAYPKIEM